jgi:hypothetical protein
MSETPDIVQNARDFIRQRDSHRESLRAELKTARERVAEIEGLLAELGDAAARTAPAPQAKTWQRARSAETGPIPGAKKMPIPVLISAIVATHPEGMGVRDIVKAVIEAKEGTRKQPAPQTVYATVYRMRDSGRLGHTGETPNVLYTSPTTEAAAE